jgi:hypothetical protein
MTSTRGQQVLHWAPRILGLLFAGFLSIFALDVFGHDEPIGRTILALLIHLVPTALVLGALAVGWRRGWAGGLAFLGLAAWYLATTWGRFPWATYAVIAGPPVLVGLLFELDWWCARRRARSGG